MHEAALMAAAVQQAVAAAEQAGASRIERVTFAIASGGHVTAETVETLFAALSQGTLAEGAALTVETRPVPAYCPACGASFIVTSEPNPTAAPRCPSCTSAALPEAGMAELALLAIEVPD